ncbi:hypothetical protein EVAR_42780_1 [Eumeta japonica]|uniref:Nose resistant-to-fluoxetine protein N-terminal domain-containing protein n=1 Tax=Eumeta variegata TaxID=151549 RepID=A0A4C1WN98_EUMVA|nr:hypothetical protein EVAR_42780_1 [Eumeta japonica]
MKKKTKSQNLDWIVFDASGQYSSSALFGNEYWLGSLNACKDLQLAEQPPHAAAFHVARVNDATRWTFRSGPVRFTRHLPLHLEDVGVNESRVISVGECLTASCTTADVKMLLAAATVRAAARARLAGLAAGARVLVVRAVPGPYDPFADHKLLILGRFQKDVDGDVPKTVTWPAPSTPPGTAKLPIFRMGRDSTKIAFRPTLYSNSLLRRELPLAVGDPKSWVVEIHKVGQSYIQCWTYKGQSERTLSRDISLTLAVAVLMLVASLYEGWLERRWRRQVDAQRRDLEMSQNGDHGKRKFITFSDVLEVRTNLSAREPSKPDKPFRLWGITKDQIHTRSDVIVSS